MRGASWIAGGIALAAVLSIVAIVAWSMQNRSDAVPSAPLTGGPALGELTGYVGRVDLKAGTVEVAGNLVGLRPVTMAVTDGTSIMVHDKRAGLGNLTKDLPVRVFYEVRNDVKYATSIKVIADDAQAKVPSPAAADTGPPVEAQSPTVTKPPAPPAVASTPAARPVPPMTDRVSASLKTGASPAPTPSRAPAPTAEAASSPSSPASAVRQADTDVGDGSAAVDWLLKESHRR